MRAVRAWHYAEALTQGLSRYSMDELLAFPGKLLEADRTLKSRSIAAGAVLEALVEKMTAGAARGAGSHT